MRVLQQIGEHLVQAARIGCHRQRRVKAAPDLGRREAPRGSAGLLGKVERDAGELPGLGVVQQVAGEVGDAGHLGADLLAYLRVGASGRHADDVQRVAHVMRHGGRELPELGQPRLRLARPLALGELARAFEPGGGLGQHGTEQLGHATRPGRRRVPADQLGPPALVRAAAGQAGRGRRRAWPNRHAHRQAQAGRQQRRLRVAPTRPAPPRLSSAPRQVVRSSGETAPPG